MVFFDSDDLMPVGFLKSCLDKYRSAKCNDQAICGIQLNLVDFPNDPFFDANKEVLADKDIVNKIIKYGSESYYGKFGHAMASFFSIKDRYSSERPNTLRPSLRAAHGIILIESFALESVGFYNRERVGMDTDLLNRLNMAGFRIGKYNGAPWFIRRTHSNSLTASNRIGLKSKYRKEVEKKYNEMLGRKEIFANKPSVDLNLVL